MSNRLFQTVIHQMRQSIDRTIGVVDESYCGDGDVLKMPVYATRDTVVHVNDRICQFRIQEHQPRIVFEEVQTLGGSDRGGFGSTGLQ